MLANMQRTVESDKGYGHNEERLMDVNHEAYSPFAQLALPIDRIPEDIQKRMIKVLSKHRTTEVREWSSKLMQSYQLLHAVEKPMNLDYAKPFANTSDFKNMSPKIHSGLAAERMKKKEKSEDQIMEEDPLSRMISSAREALGKQASVSE